MLLLRPVRSIWLAVVFLAFFAGLLALVTRGFLLPALEAARTAGPGVRAQLVAYSRLILALTLVILLMTLILVFRVARFFFPPPAGPKTKTPHVDAWAESGRRAKTPDPPE